MSEAARVEVAAAREALAVIADECRRFILVGGLGTHDVALRITGHAREADRRLQAALKVLNEG